MHTFAAASPESACLFSAEGLSYLRDRDELEWLKSALPGEVTIIAYLRKRNDYISAYRFMLQKSRVPESDDKTSVAYVGPDSWLWDYSGRLQRFRDVFGHGNVTVLDYDAEMLRDGNIIRSFVRLLQAEGSFQAGDWEDLFLNQRPRA